MLLEAELKFSGLVPGRLFGGAGRIVGNAKGDLALRDLFKVVERGLVDDFSEFDNTTKTRNVGICLSADLGDTPGERFDVIGAKN